MSIPVRNHLDIGLNQLLSALVEVLSTDPATVTNGRVFYNSTDSKFKIGRAGTWVSFYLDTTALQNIAAPTGALSLNSQKITNLADGTAVSDAVNKGQLDSVISGLDIKPSARAATTANIALTGTQTVDGVALVAGDRVLVKDQTAPAGNGIYVVSAAAWVRAVDVDTWSEIPGSLVAIEVGTTNADSLFLATADQGGVLGTTAITWTKLAPVAAGGGGGSVNKFAADITGDAVALQFTVTHNLATTDVQITVWDVTADAEILVDKKRPTANTARIDFAVAPATGKVYRVVVEG